jgi:hypothetical protein
VSEQQIVHLYWSYKYVNLVWGFCGNKTNVLVSVIFRVAGLCVVTDFRHSQWLIVNSVLGLLRHVDVGDVANVSEAHASIFRARVCKMGVFPCTEVHFFPSTQNKHGEGGVWFLVWASGENCATGHGVHQKTSGSWCSRVVTHAGAYNAWHWLSSMLWVVGRLLFVEAWL